MPKFLRFTLAGGTYVGARPVYLDVDGVEAVYPTPSGDPSLSLVEIRMSNGREYTVVGDVVGVRDAIEEQVVR